MKAQSLTKSKQPSTIFSITNKPKETSKQTNINSILNGSSKLNKSNTFRQQGIVENNIKSSKNSTSDPQDQRNYSGGKITIPSFINQNVKPINFQGNRNEEIQIDLFKNKMMKKKAIDNKINLNYTNNYFNYKNSQNSSVDTQNKQNFNKENLSKSPDFKRENKSINTKEILNPKRSTSIIDDSIKDESKLISPRFELILEKYNKMDKKTNIKTKSIEQILSKNEFLKNVFSAKSSPKAIQSKEIISDRIAVNKALNSTSRKSSKDAILNSSMKSPNLIELLSKKTNSINNKSSSFSNLKNNSKISDLNQKMMSNKINLNLDSNVITDFSKKSTPKILNNDLLLKANSLLNSNNFKNNSKLNENILSNPSLQIKKDLNENNFKYAPKIEINSSKNLLEETLVKKTIPHAVTTTQSKNKNEDSVSENKEVKKPILSVAKESSNISTLGNKKIQSSNNSPKNLSLVFKKNIEKPSKTSSKKDFINKSNILQNNNIEFIKIEDSKPKQMINLKLNLNSLNSEKGITQTDKNNNSFDNVLNTSNCSIKSTIRESNYYKKEADKLSLYIKKYFVKMNEYPSTNIKFYKFGRVLGKGAFGKVNLCLHVLSGRLVAIKSFNKNNLKSENSKKKIFYECNLMRNIRHNSVVKIYEMFETPKYIMIIMENICGGDLLSFVRKRTKLNEVTSKFIFRQIIEALQYIHSQNIVHRDIKLDNILIDLSNNIKICDFGVSKHIKKNEILYDQCGTPAYIAPEILRNNGYEGFTVDYWSAGVVLYAMLSGTVPFKANNMTDLHKLILKGNYAPIKDISEEASNLISGLLEIDTKKRLKIDQILNHAWIKSSDNNGKVKPKMNLFTNAEKILLSKSNVDYKNAQKEDLNENFTIRNLDTQKDTENQNINTKSLILAPFNSSIKKEEEFLIKEIEVENEATRFCGKAKEANRNYELNNNGEIDNGILINPQNQNSISNNNTPIASFRKDKFSNPVSPPSELDNKKISNFPSPTDTQRNNKKSGINASSTNANTFILDENIVKQLEEFGYKKDYLMKSLYANELNYSTATYFLLLNLKLD